MSEINSRKAEIAKRRFASAKQRLQTDTKEPDVQIEQKVMHESDISDNKHQMDKFLIYLAKNASPDRYMPFPAEYGITSNASEPYTSEEFKILKGHLNEIDNYPNLKKSIIDVDLGIVRHNSNSIHDSITEYEFRYPPIDEYKRNLMYKKRWYLFHGSPLGNWHSILRNGIKNMSGTRFMSTGAVHGSGVYLANDIRTSYAYGGSGKTNCIAVVELLVDPEKYNKGPCYVIPDDSILFPRYLLQVSQIPNFDGKEILSFYKKLREDMIIDNTIQSRLLSDKTFLEEKCYLLDDKYPVWHLLIHGILMKAYIYSYPFLPPVIQLNYKLNIDLPEFSSSGICTINSLKKENWTPSTSIYLQLMEIKKIFEEKNVTMDDKMIEYVPFIVVE